MVMPSTSSTPVAPDEPDGEDGVAARGHREAFRDVDPLGADRLGPGAEPARVARRGFLAEEIDDEAGLVAVAARRSRCSPGGPEGR